MSKLPTKHQKRVGRVLSIFSQHWITDKDRLRLNLPDELKRDEALLPLIERLEYALLDDETRRQVTEEDAFEATVNQSLQEAEIQGRLKEKLETARKMKAAGLSVVQICEFTELSDSEIEAL